MSGETIMATYGRLEYLHPNNSFITQPLSDAYNLITFGRDPECDIVLETPHVAAVQTKVYVDHSELWVCDAGGANGEPSLTRVNGKELGPNPQQLQPEDVIEVFNRRFRFVAEHTKQDVSMPAGLEQIRDKLVSGVGAAVEEEPMNYLAERIKSVFGEEFYDRSFEQWCDNKQYGKAYATSSGPQRNNYDWVPGPDLAAIVPLMVENALTGAVELYLPLGSFVPKQPRKVRRARRTVKSEDLLPPASSKIAGGDAPASGKNERESEKATKTTKTTARKKTIVVEEDEEVGEEVDHDEEGVYEEKRDKGEKEKEKKQKGRRTVAAVKGVKRTASKTAKVKEEDDEEDEDEDDVKEAKPSSKGRSASAAKAKAPPSKKYSRRKPVKEEDDDDEEEEASKAKEEEVNDDDDDDDFAFGGDSDDEVVKRKTTKKHVHSTKRVARRTTKKTTTTKTKSRKASDDDDDGGGDEDYNADEPSEEENVDIEGVTAEEEDDDDDDVDKENEYVAPKKKKKVVAAKRAATRKNTTSAASKKASPPAVSPVRRSGRAARGVTGSVTAKASGAALFRATKDCGKLVDPFSPTKSIQGNFKEEYRKTKSQGTPQRGVVTRRKANATTTTTTEDEPPAKPPRRGKLDL